MFLLNSEFIIGKYKWRGCNEVKITKSIHEYTDTAIIKLPATSVLRENGIRTESKQTAKQFAVGDKVSIKLGYNGKLNDEFVGFVKRINLKTPCEIESEGFSYILRTKKNIKKSWRKVSLLCSMMSKILLDSNSQLSKPILKKEKVEKRYEHAK